MFGYSFLDVNRMGNLTISGCDTTELVKKYKTPLYVMDEHEIRRRCRDIRENHIDRYNGFAVYASKAFLNREMCRIIKDEGLGLDVVSGGELFTAKSVDFPMDKVIFHGSNKTFEELEMAVDLGVGRIVIDNFNEIENLDLILKERNGRTEVLVRVIPGVDVHTHDYIATGREDSKFGLSIKGGSAIEAINRILGSKHLILKGLHSHIGSQIHQSEPYVKGIRALAEFSREIKDKFNIELGDLNVGGGFGIYYVEGDERRNISYFTDPINNTVYEEFSRLQLKKPRVIIEPGRWIVGEAGITLYTVGAIKEIQGIRKYVSVDGGMADNPRPPLYDALYSALVANNCLGSDREVVTLAGRCCESGDILIKDVLLPRVKSGDIIAVLSTGAYNYSMASNYNRLPRPAVVMVNEGKDRVIVRRESYEDLLRYDV